MSYSTEHDLFLDIWDRTPKVDFNPDWNNGTGYYDGATKDSSLKLSRGDLVAAISTKGNDRKLLIKGLGNGLNIVIFERYTNGEAGILACNKPSRRRLIKTNIEIPDISDGRLSTNDVEEFLSIG